MYAHAHTRARRTEPPPCLLRSPSDYPVITTYFTGLLRESWRHRGRRAEPLRTPYERVGFGRRRRFVNGP